METRAIRFRGGPLDGMLVGQRAGKLPSYRKDDGTRMHTQVGDNIFCSGGTARKRHGYVLTTIETVRGPERVYLHASMA